MVIAAGAAMPAQGAKHGTGTGQREMPPAVQLALFTGK